MPSKTNGRRGRPARAASGPSETQVNLKLSPDEEAILTALQAREQARIDTLKTGLPMRVGRADVLRIFLHREAERAGLVDVATAS